MDSKLDLFFYTRNKGKKFTLQWIVEDYCKIPRILDSPKFSIYSEFEDWFLRIESPDVENTEPKSLSLHYSGNSPLRVRYTVTFSGTGMIPKETEGECHFIGSDSKNLHSDLQEIVFLVSQGFLSMDFCFIIHGMDIETKDLRFIDFQDAQTLHLPKNFKVLKENKQLIDLKIHVQNETFEAHKFILRLRAPKFVDDYLKDLNVTEITLEDVESIDFRCFLNYVYEGKLSSTDSSLCTENFEDFFIKYCFNFRTYVLQRELGAKNI